MRVLCPHCGGKAFIQSRNTLSEQVSDLYCACKSPACSASFVYRLAYKTTTNPPVATTAQMAVNILRNLPKDQRAKLDLAELVGFGL